jgi:hypothetical protein
VPLKPTKGSAVGDYLLKLRTAFTSKAGVEKARAKLLIFFLGKDVLANCARQKGVFKATYLT